MPRLLTLLLLFFVLAPFSFAQAENQSWPQWRGPNRDGKAPATNLNTDWEAKPPKLLWKSEDMVGDGFGGVTIADGVIYTTGNLPNGQHVFALSEADGSLKWKTAVTDAPPKHGYQGARSEPAIDGEFLYLVPSDGQIACLKRENGEIVWKKDFKSEWNGKMMSGWGYSESPLVDGELVLCTPGGPEAMIVALKKTDGSEVWRSNAPDLGGRKTGAGYSSIVISNGGGVKQYVQLAGQGVFGVRASDGKLLWGYKKVANGTANIPTPLISGDYVFASSGYGTGSCLLQLTSDGEKVNAEEVYFLSGKEMQNHHGGMILHDGHVYCGHGHGNGMPICLELKTGKAAWGGDIRGEGKGSAAVAFADGHLIFRYQDGKVALIEATPEAYKMKGVFTADVVKQPSWAHPAICNNHLYLREKGVIMCYDLTP